VAEASRWNRKRLVIDASVARSAGETEHPVSKSCREFLEAVRGICHRLVFTEAIRDEWRRHESRYSRRWLVSMYAKKKVDRIDPDPAASMQTQIEAIPLSSRKRQAVLKDRHLLEAALLADGIVASGDDTARNILREASSTWRAVKRMVWVNPGKPEEDCCDWLAAGARAEKGRMIGTAHGA